MSSCLLIYCMGMRYVFWLVENTFTVGGNHKKKP